MSDDSLLEQETEQSKTGNKAHQVATEWKNRTRMLSNGALIDTKTGKFVSGGKVTTAISDTSQAVALARKRWDKARESFAAGIAAELRDTGMLPAVDDQDAASMYVLGSKSTSLLMAAENARGYSDLLQVVTKTAGWTPSHTDGAEQPGIHLDISPAAVGALLTALQRVRDRQQNSNSIDSDTVIDATAADSALGQRQDSAIQDRTVADE